jgi:hypothetical protein
MSQVRPTPGLDPEIQQPLLLVMPAKLETVPMLKAGLAGLDFTQINAALDQIGTVHNTRLLVLEDDEHDPPQWAKLMVAAVFDGTVEEYIGAFAIVLNDLFNLLFQFVVDTPDKPRVPVRDHVEEFVAYVVGRDCKAPGTPYSICPDVTALDVFEAMRR